MTHKTLSIVIPVYNAAETLKECLTAIFQSDYPDFEAIVVDDASSDNSGGIAAWFPCKLISLKQNRGSSAARNEGIKNAKGEIVVFIDADIIIKSNTFQSIADLLKDEDLAAVVGVYSAYHRNKNISSQYKNFWLRFTRLKTPQYIPWICTSITGIKKKILLKIGFFNEQYRSETGLDDVEFGTRLFEKDYKILVVPQLEVEHLKSFSFKGLMKNQYLRSKAWTEFVFKTRRAKKTVIFGRFANITADFILGIIVSFLILITAGLSFSHTYFIYILFIFFIIYIYLNLGFLLSAKKTYSLIRTFQFLSVLFVSHIVCGFGIIKGLTGYCVKGINENLGAHR
jgi:glycosyltransferase involved in cell wall biosynthesis